MGYILNGIGCIAVTFEYVLMQVKSSRLCCIIRTSAMSAEHELILVFDNVISSFDDLVLCYIFCIHHIKLTLCVRDL
jgi:hypothetical protein